MYPTNIFGHTKKTLNSGLGLTGESIKVYWLIIIYARISNRVTRIKKGNRTSGMMQDISLCWMATAAQKGKPTTSNHGDYFAPPTLFFRFPFGMPFNTRLFQKSFQYSCISILTRILLCITDLLNLNKL